MRKKRKWLNSVPQDVGELPVGGATPVANSEGPSTAASSTEGPSMFASIAENPSSSAGLSKAKFLMAVLIGGSLLAPSVAQLACRGEIASDALLLIGFETWALFVLLYFLLRKASPQGGHSYLRLSKFAILAIMIGLWAGLDK
jgi:hypothetical protein